MSARDSGWGFGDSAVLQIWAVPSSTRMMMSCKLVVELLVLVLPCWYSLLAATPFPRPVSALLIVSLFEELLRRMRRPMDLSQPYGCGVIDFLGLDATLASRSHEIGAHVFRHIPIPARHGDCDGAMSGDHGNYAFLGVPF